MVPGSRLDRKRIMTFIPPSEMAYITDNKIGENPPPDWFKIIRTKKHYFQVHKSNIIIIQPKIPRNAYPGN